MRIKDHEYQDIVSCLSDAGLKITDFDFIKKKGWFHLMVRNSEQFFSFHRKVEVEIVDGNFEEELIYRFKSEKASGEKNEWNKVVKELKVWLVELDIPT